MPLLNSARWQITLLFKLSAAEWGLKSPLVNRLERRMPYAVRFILLATAWLGLAALIPAAVGQEYNRDILPILSEYCFACHGPDAEARQGGLRLDTHAGALAEADSGEPAIVPNAPDESELIRRIEAEDESERMPPPESGKSLSSSQRQMLRQWLEAGADYQRHWAFEPPVAAEPPLVEGVAHPIDRYVQSRLLAAGLSPSPLAPPATLLRRVSLDLTGLPPSLAELDAFQLAWCKDPELAYAAVVESLLSSPHYGERWGRWWLDQARYADSNGYSIDAPRTIWKYRDWVVDALNNDMPFDQFTIEQLAGDLLPPASDPRQTQAHQIATGFHRNTPLNQEGGIDVEQFRIDSVMDRVATTGTVWLGLTIGCAQCHDHKFDPISQREYYQFFAFFNNQDEPTLEVHDYRRDPQGGDAESVTTTLVMRERPQPRVTNLFIKGDFTRRAEEVTPATPEVLHPLDLSSHQPQDASPNRLPNRLDLAKWIVSPDNPLTARVIVNRVWQVYFGRGIVETENDFGALASSPSHPELLDWLAVEFQTHQWSLKELHRLIVSSHTYQQSSRERPELQASDPRNYLLGKQQRLRLEAELIRDMALSACDLLSPELGGAPVFPPIPAGVMDVGQVKRQWKTSHGADRFRRGLYTFLYRGTPPPALTVFDAPDGLSTCTRRMRSNTPLQALTLLNDAGFFEFAQALEKIILSDGIEAAFRRCTSRPPTADELEVLHSLDSLSAARVLLNLDETVTRE